MREEEVRRRMRRPALSMRTPPATVASTCSPLAPPALTWALPSITVCRFADRLFPCTWAYRLDNRTKVVT